MFRGYAEAHLGHQRRADEDLDEAQKLAEESRSPLVASVLQIKGLICSRRNQFTYSQNYLTESLRLARLEEDKSIEASDLLDLGYLALQIDHYGEALDRFTASAEAAASVDARGILERDRGNIGWTNYKMGDYELAMVNLRKAEEQARELGSVIAGIFWLDRESRCLAQLGELGEAEKSYLTALRDAESIHNSDMVADIHTKLGLLYLQMGKLDLAKSHTEQAVSAVRSAGDEFTETNTILLQGLIASREGKHAAAMQSLMAADKDATDLPSLRWNAENAIAAESAGSGQPQQADLWYRKSIATFEAERSSVKDEELRLPFFANGDELYRDYADFLIQSHHADEALRLLDLGRARTLSEGLGQSAAPGAAPNPAPSNLKNAEFHPQAVARGQNATILFYSLGAEKSWLWAINAHETRCFALPKRAEIEARVHAYLKSILKSSDALREQNSDAQALYDALVAPAAAMVTRGSRVVLIPDGVLNQLNFETLLVHDAAGEHYWIEDVTLCNANSIHLLSRAKANRSAAGSKSILLMGDAVAKGTDFENLPNAPAEMNVIGNLFPAEDRRVLTQASAVPAAYATSKPEQFTYIHFVAHGTASQLSPLDSAVVLSPPADKPESYKLYARDIVHHPIHADLVTISACYGSGTRAYAGEGLVGLSWAFLRAGSHKVIGALWEVDDASTPQLMKEMYSGLMAGADPDAALRNAKLTLINSGGIYRKPLYWGAFQLYAGS